MSSLFSLQVTPTQRERVPTQLTELLLVLGLRDFTAYGPQEQVSPAGPVFLSPPPTPAGLPNLCRKGGKNGKQTLPIPRQDL